MRSEVLFNLSLSLLQSNKSPEPHLKEAFSSKEVHDEQKSTFNAGLHSMNKSTVMLRLISMFIFISIKTCSLCLRTSKKYLFHLSCQMFLLEMALKK